MLEHASIFLHPWIHGTLKETGLAWTRPITDEAGHTLGHVCFEGTPRNPLFRWLQKIRLNVYETEDASHLMTLTRQWGVLGSWEVEDADLRHVGNVYSKAIVTSTCDCLGYIDRSSEEEGRILDVHGAVRVTYTRRADVVEVRFTPEPAINPFVRMLFLASILSMDPIPPRKS